jgi:predicted amidohydrolase
MSKMKDIVMASAQFEHHSNDKAYNLKVIEELSARASKEHADAINFHELSITGYTFLQDLEKDELNDISEELTSSSSLKILKQMAGDLSIVIMAGLVERRGGNFYNTYVAVNGKEILASFSKLHPFINKYLSPGEGYTFFELKGWKCSILICYDNNIVENVRAVALTGAQILIAPHVTGGTPSPMPGRGFIDERLWENRHNDPVPIRAELNGPKGREWLMHWLPARAFDNGIYLSFSNAIGMDHDHIVTGGAMILDPFGDIMAESSVLGDDLVLATCIPEKLKEAGGYRYRIARRPELYADILGSKHSSITKPVWMKDEE